MYVKFHSPALGTSKPRQVIISSVINSLGHLINMTADPLEKITTGQNGNVCQILTSKRNHLN